MVDRDELLLENERLRDENEHLLEQIDRLRVSERTLRASSITPCEQVTLYRWSLIDKIHIKKVYAYRNEVDFPPSLAVYGSRGTLYDLEQLRVWLKAHLERVATLRDARAAAKREETAWFKEFYHDERVSEW